VDVRELVFGSGIPDGLAGMTLNEQHWNQNPPQAAIYEMV